MAWISKEYEKLNDPYEETSRDEERTPCSICGKSFHSDDITEHLKQCNAAAGSNKSGDSGGRPSRERNTGSHDKPGNIGNTRIPSQNESKHRNNSSDYAENNAKSFASDKSNNIKCRHCLTPIYSKDLDTHEKHCKKVHGSNISEQYDEDGDGRGRNTPQYDNVDNPRNKNDCGRCGMLHIGGKCKAVGFKCSTCGGKNHLPSMCRNKQGGGGKIYPDLTGADRETHGSQSNYSDEEDLDSECGRCQLPHVNGNCIADGNTCVKCGGKNHLAKVCHNTLGGGPKPYSSSTASAANYKIGQTNSYTQKCKRCGTQHGPGRCIAHGVKCSNCGGMNHFDTQCLNKQGIGGQTPSNRSGEDDGTYSYKAKQDTNYSQDQMSSKQQNCKRCGSRHGPFKCTAHGATCHKCGGKNHFSQQCLNAPGQGGQSSTRGADAGQASYQTKQGQTSYVDDQMKNNKYGGNQHTKTPGHSGGQGSTKPGILSKISSGINNLLDLFEGPSYNEYGSVGANNGVGQSRVDNSYNIGNKNDGNCRRCGSLHGPRMCPAHGVTCDNCGGRNHFSSMCSAKQGGGHSSPRGGRKDMGHSSSKMGQNEEDEELSRALKESMKNHKEKTGSHARGKGDGAGSSKWDGREGKDDRYSGTKQGGNYTQNYGGGGGDRPRKPEDNVVYIPSTTQTRGASKQHNKFQLQSSDGKMQSNHVSTATHQVSSTPMAHQHYAANYSPAMDQSNGKRQSTDVPTTSLPGSAVRNNADHYIKRNEERVKNKERNEGSNLSNRK